MISDDWMIRINIIYVTLIHISYHVRTINTALTVSHIQMHFEASAADETLSQKENVLIMSNFTLWHNVFNTFQ